MLLLFISIHFRLKKVWPLLIVLAKKSFMKMGKKTMVLLSIALLYLAWMMVAGCESQNKSEDESITLITYVGSETCKSCHVDAFADWQTSDHYKAMAHAADSTVLGDFDDATFEADGVKSRFFKKDGKFFIHTEGEDGRYKDFEVKFTFGHFPLQQYLIEFPNGRLQATRLSWDSREGRWFNQYSGEKIPHNDWLHWTGNGQNWNTMCASCHSTDLKKGYDFASDSYHTTFNEINVGCESCHGPGSAHVALAKKENYKTGNHSTFIYGKGGSNTDQLKSCAPCHARKSDISANPMHSKEWMDDYIPQLISNDFYFADGQIKEEDFEYGSFVQSKMYHNGVKCSDCHNPHSGRLNMEGNAQCMSCHEPKYNSSQHHFHKELSEGAQCVNCHMPAKTYMGNDHRRDHSFRIPRPDQSMVYGTPNACTSCHSEKKPTWAAETVRKWYGPERAYHFSDDLLPGSLMNEKSEYHLIKLLSDTSQPAIARATAAKYLGDVVTKAGAKALMEALKDNHAVIRYYALKSLSNFPPEVWQNYAPQYLSDPVRSVRIACASLYRGIGGAEAVPPTSRNAYLKADSENKTYLEYQTDFAVGNLLLADYYAQGYENKSAIQYYERGLEKDFHLNYARLNLSALYSAEGNNAEALNMLNVAAEIDESNDRIFYSLALLHYEMGDIEKAIFNFERAIDLESKNEAVYYNYGLILIQQGKLKEAEKKLKEGYRLQPFSPAINYALAYLYSLQGKIELARKHALVLRRVDPENIEYQELFQSLGI